MSNKQIAKRSKWAVDFNSPPKGAPLKLKSKDTLESVGFSESRANVAQTGKETADAKLISKRSWNIALGPIKQVPMNLFIMYMSGSSISIFPIMVIGMMVFRPIKAVMAFKDTFKVLDQDSNSAILQKIVWLFGNVLGICVALWKCHSMGILPTSPSDWLAFKEHRERVEFVIGGLSQ
ncbi:ER membrane protein complex subunit 4-like [Clytia hemisphaerica]|uniref:ER membrane protein complex subunit 4-like n=1 Tax=Clytia hemisphaerica TaxID=252671 RepID=UPI0034D5EBAB